MIRLRKIINVRTGKTLDIIGMEELEANLFDSTKRKNSLGIFVNTMVTLMENKFYYRETVASNFAREPEGISVTVPVITKEGSTTEELEFPFVIKDEIDGFIVFKNGHICPITINDGEETVVALETVSFEYGKQPVTRQADASYGIMVMGNDLEESIKGHNESVKDNNCIIGYYLHEEDE